MGVTVRLLCLFLLSSTGAAPRPVSSAGIRWREQAGVLSASTHSELIADKESGPAWGKGSQALCSLHFQQCDGITAALKCGPQQVVNTSAACAGDTCTTIDVAACCRAERVVAPGVTVVGLALALLSSFFNGTFSIFGKMCREAPDPVLFNSCVCVGAMLSSVCIIPFLSAVQPLCMPFPLGFTPAGFLCGALLVFATLFSFVAIPQAGLASASATWCCSAILVAFLWGSFGPRNPGPGAELKNVTMTAAALGLLILGVLCITFCEAIAGRFGYVPVPPSTPLPMPNQGGDDDAEQQLLGKQEGLEQAKGNRVLGLLSAAFVGLFGGSILVPASYVRPDLQGLPLTPSFGVGAGTVGCFVGLVYWRLRGMNRSLRHELRGEVVLWGCVSGCVWNAGNVAQIIAMHYYGMPYGIAYPILQCALFVSGLWGIYMFGEVTCRGAITAYWIGAATLLSGAALLGMYGPGAS